MASIEEMIHSALSRCNEPLKGRTALVTGASSGIGLAVAARLAQEGCRLHLVARREDRLQELRRQLIQINNQVEIHIHGVDLTRKESIVQLQNNGAFDSDILINNAGLAKGLARITDSKPSDWSQMLDTNVNAAFTVSRLAAQNMIAKKRGDIIVLSSVAAHAAYENGAVYCATKHAVKAFHEALRLETLEHGLRVMMISPGMVETEFSLVRFSGDTQRAQSVYQGVKPLEACDIAECILFALKQPTHINLDDLVIKPQQQGNPWRVWRNE